MTDKHTQQQAQQGNMEKDPADWVTGDEPMTGAQRSYLKTLSEGAHVPFDDGLTKAQASQRIDELQARTGRGEHARTPTGQREEDPDGPLESLGRAVSAPVLDSAPPDQPVGTAQGRSPSPGR